MKKYCELLEENLKNLMEECLATEHNLSTHSPVELRLDPEKIRRKLNLVSLKSKIFTE